MPFEQVNYSQVVTFAPANPKWTNSIIGGGISAPGQLQFGAFTGYAYFTAGSQTSPAPAAAGDVFQLYNSGTLKESTLFTVAGVLQNQIGGNWFVFFTPAPQSVPSNGNTATSIPRPKSARWLGSIGHVNGLVRAYSCPGGPDTMTLQLLLPADYRTDALDPGRVVQIWRGASCVWEGKLDEPQPSPTGWTVTAHGAGNYGTDFAAIYTTWNADDAVNQAIGRGMRWVNPGIGTPPGLYLAQVQDSGSETVTAHLGLLITGGGLMWLVTRGNASALPAGPWSLSVFPFTSDSNGNPLVSPSRLLISNSPVARTIAADINTMVLRYQVTADVQATGTKPAVAATFSTTIAKNALSVAKHGPMEYFLDLSSAGVMTAAAAQAIGTNILNRYVRASWAGPFVVGPGQVLNQAGVPVDLGCDEACGLPGDRNRRQLRRRGGRGPAAVPVRRVRVRRGHADGHHHPVPGRAHGYVQPYRRPLPRQVLGASHERHHRGPAGDHNQHRSDHRVHRRAAHPDREDRARAAARPG